MSKPIEMAVFPTLDERQRRIAKDMAHAAVAVLREHGLEKAEMRLESHDHLRLLVEVASSWLISAEGDPTPPTLELKRRGYHDGLTDEERERREGDRGRDDRSGGR